MADLRRELQEMEPNGGSGEEGELLLRSTYPFCAKAQGVASFQLTFGDQGG